MRIILIDDGFHVLYELFPLKKVLFGRALRDITKDDCEGDQVTKVLSGARS